MVGKIAQVLNVQNDRFGMMRDIYDCSNAKVANSALGDDNLKTYIYIGLSLYLTQTLTWS